MHTRSVLVLYLPHGKYRARSSQVCIHYACFGLLKAVIPWSSRGSCLTIIKPNKATIIDARLHNWPDNMVASNVVKLQASAAAVLLLLVTANLSYNAPPHGVYCSDSSHAILLSLSLQSKPAVVAREILSKSVAHSPLTSHLALSFDVACWMGKVRRMAAK